MNFISGEHVGCARGATSSDALRRPPRSDPCQVGGHDELSSVRLDSPSHVPRVIFAFSLHFMTIFSHTSLFTLGKSISYRDHNQTPRLKLSAFVFPVIHFLFIITSTLTFQMNS